MVIHFCHIRHDWAEQSWHKSTFYCESFCIYYHQYYIEVIYHYIVIMKSVINERSSIKTSPYQLPIMKDIPELIPELLQAVKDIFEKIKD